MKKEIITSEKGYEIPIIHNIQGDESAVVLISHGFGSTKESPTVKIISEAMEKEGIASLAFDFPAHGDSPVDGEEFTIDNCLRDMAAAEKEIIKKAPTGRIYYFSSSFGAYMNLLYLSLQPHRGEKSFLRCPAVDMPGILREEMTPEIEKAFREDGFITLEEGFVRPLKLTKTFYDQLQNHNVFKIYKQGDCTLMMVHGTEDESASPEKAKEFGDHFRIPILWIPGADHTFSGEGMMDRVAQATVTFFCQ